MNYILLLGAGAESFVNELGAEGHSAWMSYRNMFFSGAVCVCMIFIIYKIIKHFIKAPIKRE